MRSIIGILVFLAIAGGGVVSVFVLGGSEYGDMPVSEAWTEYRYQNFSKTRSMFRDILGNDERSADDRLQAKMGLGMLTDFQMPGQDPARAIDEYKAVLDEIDSTHALRPNLLLLIGDCYFRLPNPNEEDRQNYVNNPNFRMAEEYYNRLIEEYPEHLLARSATIQKAYIKLKDVRRESFEEAVTILEADLARNPRSILAGTMHGICARVLQALGGRVNLLRARKHLMDWLADDDGDGEFELVMNQNSIRDIMFQIARLSEMELNDSETAIKYYRKLMAYTEIDERYYLCKLRIEALGGKVEDGE